MLLCGVIGRPAAAFSRHPGRPGFVLLVGHGLVAHLRVGFGLFATPGLVLAVVVGTLVAGVVAV